MNIGRINDSKSLSSYIETSAKPNLLIMAIIDYQQVVRVCQNSFSAKDSYHFVKNNRYQRVNNSMITVTLIFMRE